MKSVKNAVLGFVAAKPNKNSERGKQQDTEDQFRVIPVTVKEEGTKASSSKHQTALTSDQQDDSGLKPKVPSHHRHQGSSLVERDERLSASSPPEQQEHSNPRGPEREEEEPEQQERKIRSLQL